MLTTQLKIYNNILNCELGRDLEITSAVRNFKQ